MALPANVLDHGRVTQAYGAVIGFYPGDARFEIEVERADDDGGGSPDLGTLVVLGTLAPGEQAFIDDTAGSVGLIYHYRGRHVRTGYDDGSNTSWVAVNTVQIPEVIPDRPPVVPMSMDVNAVEGTGVVTIYVDGAPSFRSVKWATSLSSFPDPTSGTVAALDSDGDATIDPSVTLSRGQEVFVSVAFYGQAGGAGPVLGTLRRSYTYAGIVIPTLEDETQSETTTTGTHQVKVLDPEGLATALYFRTKSGAGSWTAWTLKTGSPVHNTSYSETVTLVEGKQSYIEWQLWYDVDGNTFKVPLASGGFDKGQIPNISVELTIDDAGILSANVSGDIDTASIKIVASTSGQPSDATCRAASAKNGRMFTRADIGTLATLDIGETGYVTVFGYSATGGGGNESSESVKNQKVRPGEFVPQVFVNEVRGGTTAVVTVDVEDNFLAVTAIEYKKRDAVEGGDTLDATWQTAWTSTVGTIGVNETLQRVINVTSDEGLEGELQWRVQYTDANGTTQTIGDSFKIVNMEETEGTIVIPYGSMVERVNSTFDGEREITSGWLMPGNLDSNEQFHAGVVFPPGVTITDIEMTAYRNTTSPDSVVMNFETTDKASSGASTNLGTLTHSTTGWQTVTSSISETVGVDDVYWLHLVMRSDVSLSDSRYRVFKATYTRPAYKYGY